MGRSTLGRTALLMSIAAVSILVSLLIAELATRKLLPEYQSLYTARAMWQYDEQLGWLGISNLRAQQGLRETRVTVQLNSLGLRDDEPEERREKQGTRILLLGDSFVFGYGVEGSECLGAQLEAMTPGIEAVNLGVSGYSTDQELLLLQRLGPSYDPDIVVLVFVYNDLPANRSTLGHGHPKPRFRIEDCKHLHLENVPVPHSDWRIQLKYALVRNSALFNLVRGRLAVLAERIGLRAIFRDQEITTDGAPTPGEQEPSLAACSS